MNTKTFAQQARQNLLKGVSKKLNYWGFNEDGTVNEQPESISGGYSFRGKVFDDPQVTKLWSKLYTAVKENGIDAVIEKAAYTWFNRIIALRILSKNGYERTELEYVEGMNLTPQILQRARQGQYSFLSALEQERLQKVITDFSKDQEAFAILFIGYCHNHKTLNRIFGGVDDYTELLLPDNILQEDGFLNFLNTTDAISDEEYKQVELIGWLYQFYISEKKDEVFASFKKNKKAEAKDIPAATQIFTPNWIVKYMVQNTVGKIWLDKKPSSALKSEMKYLVTNESDNNSEPIINDPEELTLIDPACGSGHILVEGFDILYQIYQEEYYSKEETVELILKKNLYGIDIDDRAAQLANFAVLLKAAKVYPDIWEKDWLPNVYAMPEAVDFSLQEVKDFLGKEGAKYAEQLLEAIILLKKGKNLGSIIKFGLEIETIEIVQNRFEEVDKMTSRDFNLETAFQGLEKYLKVLLILSKKFSAVVGNPPYMGQKSMNAQLKDYVNSNYPNTKSDLMTVFMEVIPYMTEFNSRFALINLPSWLFLSSFEKIRKSYIENLTFDSLLHMGRGIFGVDFGSVAFSIKKVKPEDAIGSYFRLHERNFQHILYQDIEKLFLYSNGKENYKYDFNKYRGEEGITEIPEKGTFEGKKLFYPNIPQSNFNKIPGSPIAYWVCDTVISNFQTLPDFNSLASVRQGMATSDNGRFVRLWHEVSHSDTGLSFSNRIEAKKSGLKWFPYNKGGAYRKWYGNVEFVVNWENDGKEISEFRDYKNSTLTSNMGVAGLPFIFKENITWSKISSSSFSVRYLPEGFLFDVSGCSIYADTEELNYFLLLLNSKVIVGLVSSISPTLNFEVGTIKSLPIKKVELSIKKDLFVSISKNDWDSRETSWEFEKSPLLNDSISIIKAYQIWKELINKHFFQLHTNEEELNRVFIDIYGLQEELTPEVALKDITILQEELDRNTLETLETIFREQGKEAIDLPIKKDVVISQFLSYGIGLFMGRYRLDKHGLNIAHPEPSKEELANYEYNGKTMVIDEDAIVPLMGSACNFTDDVVYLMHNLLDVIWGEETRTENVNFIQECLGRDIEKFMVNNFWKYHCDMYKKKPIYWLFQSKKKAFQVLVYMHRMNEFTVEKIRANYLMERMKYLRSEIELLDQQGASISSQEGKKLDKMRKDLLDCEDYDLRLKDIADQQIKFDLDDGVAANYKLFESVVAKIK